jgi:hypothetical protein
MSMHSKMITHCRIMLVMALPSCLIHVIRIPLAITEARSAGVAQPATAFAVAMTPHIVNNNIINYTTRTHSMLYKAASKGLFGDTKQDKYDLAPKGLLTFLNEFAA